VAAVVIAAVILLLPVSRGGARGAARRAQCAHNLKSIGRAIDAYSREYGALPPPFSVDAERHPLHSWRVLLLPYLDERAAGGIDLEKPWDDPANAAAAVATAEPYGCPALQAPAGKTTYHLVVSPEGLVRPDRSATLEEANVDITQELMGMLRAQQIYNGNARMLQTAMEVASRVTDKL
jgi:hypothetical protein